MTKVKMGMKLKNNMRLGNYLLKIASPDLGRSNGEQIYMYNVDSIFKELYLELKSNTGKKTLKFISSELGINEKTIESWIYGHNPIPILKFYEFLELWKNTCEKSEEDVNKRWDDIFQDANKFSAWSSSKVTLPKEINEEIAYLCGFLVGDGYVKDEFVLKNSKRNAEFSICLSDASKEFSEYLSSLFLKNFNAVANIYFAKDDKGSWYTTRCTSKPVYRFFTQIIKVDLGKDTGNVHIPELIKNGSDEVKRSFISGFFDAEGSVGINKKGYWLEIGQVHYKNEMPPILVWIKDFLAESKIELKGPSQMKHKNAWRLRCSNKKTISEIYHTIHPRHHDKVPTYEEIARRLK
jgi:intein/homing endonuclease